MANNPIDTNSFQHFLLIRGAEYEIIEPVNFDKSNFKCEQDNYARDTFYGNENDLLEFYQNYGSQGQTFVNNNGVLISHLPSGLDLLLQENRDNGSESDVKYILKKDGVEFTTGNFDFTTAETDNVTYFKCKVIQNTAQAKIKKREKLIVDLLSDKDLDDNTITPIVTQRMLLKAKPIYSEAKFKDSGNNAVGISSFSAQNGLVQTPSSGGIFRGANNGIVVVEYDENSLGFLSTTEPMYSDGTLQNEGFTFYEAVNDLSDVNIDITNLVAYTSQSKTNSGSTTVLSGNGRVRLVVRVGIDVNTFTEYVLYEKLFGFVNSTAIEYLPTSYSLNIPFMSKGERIYIYLQPIVENVSFNNTTSILANYTVNSVMEHINVDINAVSTAIDSVVNAVRWVDLIKQNYKAIGSLPVNAPKFDIGGEFYDNFCFSKNLIKQELTKPFNVKLSDTIESLEEVNADAQINSTEIYVGQYTDFYRNIDMGGFLIKPDIESNFTKNERYLVNEFNYGYEKYEQDRDERNTVDAIHTNSQWFPQTQNSINTKEVKLPFIRDPFAIEVARKNVFSIKENSNDTDDNIFITDVIELPPNSKGEIKRYLNYLIEGNGTIKILSDNSFNWLLLGFNIGDTIFDGVNNINRVVIDITNSILTLYYQSPAGVTYSGNTYFHLVYNYTGVMYVNRTNQGLIFSNNLRNADNFSNLRYSIKRNLRHWFPNLSTYGKFILNKKIKNTFFKSNGEATTQFIGEPLPIKENEDILISEISDNKILNQDIFKTIVECSFQQGVKLLNDIQNVRGFIRVQSPDGSVIKGYVKESNNIWSLDELELELECKNESDFLTITYSSGLLTINEVGYSQKVANIKLYNIFNDYIQFFDTNNVNLCNRTKFDKVLLNGISYTSVTDLVNAIELL